MQAYLKSQYQTVDDLEHMLQNQSNDSRNDIKNDAEKKVIFTQKQATTQSSLAIFFCRDFI